MTTAPESSAGETDSSGDDLLFIAAISFAAVASIGYVLGSALWLAGQVSGVLSGHGWPRSTTGDVAEVTLQVVQHPANPAAAWPVGGVQPGPAWLIYLLLVLFLSPLVYVLYVLLRIALNWRRRREFRRLRLGFASGLEVRRMLSASTVAKKAGSTRPSFKGRRSISPREVGFFLGQDIRSRQNLYGSVEDVFIILAPPRQGKDVHFCAPFTIDAPGPCIVTSTRADAFTNTYAMRARVGKVHVFDPNGLTNWPEALRWSPIRGCDDPMVAANRSVAIITGSGLSVSGDSAYWVSASITVLRCYLHAASLGGKNMRDIMRWSTQPTNPEPMNLLRKAEADGLGAPGWAAVLESLAGTPDPRHRGITWATVTQALTCFADPRVLEACSPAAEELFDLDEFLSGRNTLYILGKEKKNGSVAPVVTAMMEDLFDGARQIAGRMPGSRLDPPLTVELNEAAHIAPLPNLPSYMGDSGGFSIALHVYLQSLSQARAKWGSDEAMIMWDNAAIRVIMGGAGNVDDLEDISRLMGDFREKNVLRTRGARGQSETVRPEWRRVLSSEEIRTLEFGRAVVVARAARPVEVRLVPWWKRKDGKEIAAGKRRTEKLVAEYGNILRS